MKLKNIFIILLFITVRLSANEVLIPYEIDNKIGFLNEKLEVIHSPQFDSLSLCLEKQCIAFKRSSDGTLNHYIITSEKIIRKPKEAIRCIIVGDDYYGFIYDYWKDSKTGIEGTVLYSHNNSDKHIFKDIYFQSSSNQEYIEIEDINNIPRRNYMNLAGEKIFATKQNFNIKDFNITVNRGFIRKDFSDYLVDEKLNLVSGNKFNFYYGFSNDGLILGNTDSETGFFDTNGQLVIPIVRVPEMYIGFCCNRLPVVINLVGQYELYSHEDCYSKEWAIINQNGEIIKNHIEADMISGYSSVGIAVLRKYEDDKTKNYLIDINGDFLLNYSFDKIQSFENGYSRAKKDGVDYLISSKDLKVYKCKDFY